MYNKLERDSKLVIIKHNNIRCKKIKGAGFKLILKATFFLNLFAFESVIYPIYQYYVFFYKVINKTFSTFIAIVAPCKKSERKLENWRYDRFG